MIVANNRVYKKICFLANFPFWVGKVRLSLQVLYSLWKRHYSGGRGGPDVWPESFLPNGPQRVGHGG